MIQHISTKKPRWEGGKEGIRHVGGKVRQPIKSKTQKDFNKEPSLSCLKWSSWLIILGDSPVG